MSISVEDWKRIKYLDQLIEQGGPEMAKTIDLAASECDTIEQLEKVIALLMDPKSGLLTMVAETAQNALKEAGWANPQETALAVQTALNEGQEAIAAAKREQNAVLVEKLTEMKAEIGDKSPELLGVVNQLMNMLEE